MAAVEVKTKLVAELCDRISEGKHSCLIKQHIEECIYGKRLKRKEKVTQALTWLHWARSSPHLKVVSASVPTGILPDGQTGELHDVKVSCRGPDDIIFDRDAEIRQKVARGNCFLEIQGGPNGGTTCVTYALKKFTGGFGDDDDRDKGDNYTWKQYFTKPFEEAKTVVATRKANGEAAHLAVRKISGSYVIFGGSKNVHMAFRSKADIKLYGEVQRYTVASEVSETIMDLLDGMEPAERNRLLEFMSVTEFTAIFEILCPTHQHVEQFTHLKKPLLQFITWTSCDLEPSIENQLCCMPPHVGIEIARALGIPTVDYAMLTIDDVDQRMNEIRLGYGYEGEVLYFLDSSSSVIGLLKKKTIWYILCRAIREKLRAAAHSKEKRPDFQASRAVKKMQARILEIQSWLGLDDVSTEAWKVLGSEFMLWCLHHIDTGKLRLHDITDLFPVTWSRFLEESEKTDRIQPEWREPPGSDE